MLTFSIRWPTSRRMLGLAAKGAILLRTSVSPMTVLFYTLRTLWKFNAFAFEHNCRSQIIWTVVGRHSRSAGSNAAEGSEGWNPKVNDLTICLRLGFALNSSSKPARRLLLPTCKSDTAMCCQQPPCSRRTRTNNL